MQLEDKKEQRYCYGDITGESSDPQCIDCAHNKFGKCGLFNKKRMYITEVDIYNCSKFEPLDSKIKSLFNVEG